MTLLSFENVAIKENNDPLVDLAQYDFVLAPMYFNDGLSNDPKMYLRKIVADKLLAVQDTLPGYQFKIWDGYRSRDVQRAIYNSYWDSLQKEHPEWDEDTLKKQVGTFVTTPDNSQRIPPHATGGAVDLTLINVETGEELPMGTVFDHFGPEAAPGYYDGKSGFETFQNNRQLLRNAMLEAGFANDSDEWWHFDYGNQKWAAELGLEEAMFGEAQGPSIPQSS